MSVIKNGSTGDIMIVNNEGQASVIAETQPQAAHHALEGRSFIIHSSFISASATADQTSAIIFIKNTSTTQNLYLGRLRTCGEAAMKWIMKYGATGMSAETSIVAENMNIGNQTPLDADIRFGAQDSTVTGGTVIATWINGVGHSDPNYRGSIILPANASVTLECLPFASVAAEVCISIECWQD